MTNLHSILKSRDITLPTKVKIVKGMVFSSHVWILELDHKEDRALKNWCFWTVMLEKMLESSLDCKEIKSVNPKGSQPWIGRTHAEWSLSSNTLATWCEEPTFWKRLWCWERSKANGERGSRGWDSDIASQTQRTWIWATSRKQWRIEEPGVVQSTGSQRAGHDSGTEQQKKS